MIDSIKVVLKVGEREIELTLAEVKELQAALDNLAPTAPILRGLRNEIYHHQYSLLPVPVITRRPSLSPGTAIKDGYTDSDY